MGQAALSPDGQVLAYTVSGPTLPAELRELHAGAYDTVRYTVAPGLDPESFLAW